MAPGKEILQWSSKVKRLAKSRKGKVYLSVSWDVMVQLLVKLQCLVRVDIVELNYA